MKKNMSEIYQNIVNAEIGEMVCTRHKSGIEYTQSIEDALQQQGYVRGKDFEHVFDWRTCKSYIKKLSTIADYKEPQHDLKIGDMIYNMWGYDQTNIDYYQIIATTAKTVSLRKVKSGNVSYDAQQMTGKSKPVANLFASTDVIRKTPHFFMNEWHIDFEYGSGSKWDGKPMNYSCYA